MRQKSLETHAARVGPVALVLAVALGFWIGFGVRPGDAALYLGYELAYIVVPGWLAYRALSPQPGSRIRQLAIGWALGYVLEVLAFIATAGTGHRGLLVVYPIAVALVALPVMLRRGRLAPEPPEPEPPSPSRFRWALAAVCSLAIAYTGAVYFTQTPLPSAERDIAYFPDHLYHVSIAAEAKHHWPIRDANVAGEPKPYHFFVHIHMAAASRITGLELPLVYFRLYVVPLVVLVALGVALAGRTLARDAWTGLIAACLVVFVGELDLDPREFFGQFPFLGTALTHYFISASFLFGLVLFVPLLLLIAERIEAPSPRFGGLAPWLLVLLFMIGASDAKVTILPLLLGGLVLYGLWDRHSRGRWNPGALVSAALAASVMAAVYLIQYRGAASGVSLDLIAFPDTMPAVMVLKGYATDAVGDLPGSAAVLTTAGIVVGWLGLGAAQLAGLYWLLRERGLRLLPHQRWLLAVVVAGLAMVTFFRGSNQTYFLDYALVAGCLVSAEGLRLAWSRHSAAIRAATPRLAPLILVWAALLVTLIAVSLSAGAFDGDAHRDAGLLLLWYGGFVLLSAGLYLVARRGPGGPAVGAALVTAAVVAIGATDAPVDYRVGTGLTPPTSPPGGRFQAEAWIRDHTDSDDVLAVNRHVTLSGPNVFEYSAFGERRVYLEGWLYADRSIAAGVDQVVTGRVNPFADQLRINDAAFRGDPEALRTLVSNGVRYLVVDRGGSPPASATLRRIARPVYENRAISVLELPRTH